MGNHISGLPRSSRPKTAKLFDNQGNLQQIEVPITVAELLFETPGHIISPFDDIRRTRRIPAMRADEELQAGKVYLLFPEKRIYCKVSEIEMELINDTCRKRGLKSRTKVFPGNLMTVLEDEKREEVVFGLLGESGSGFSGHRKENSRPWMPVLEPIYE